MLEYLVGRLAEALTKGDVFELFGLLEKRYKTVSKICERIGIERKTFYHWKNTRQINAETKVKALKAALEEHPIATLEFLAKKTKTMTKDVLAYLMVLLRQEILSEEDPEKLAELVKEAESIINEYSTSIIEYLRHEAGDLVEAVHSRGHELKIVLSTPSVEEGIEMWPKFASSSDKGALSYSSAGTALLTGATIAPVTSSQFSSPVKLEERKWNIP